MLDRLKDEPVLMSVHSAGCTAEVANILDLHRPRGVIMHWFTGQPHEADKLLSLGCYFSVNTAVRREILSALPFDRLLPETDFPATRRRTGGASPVIPARSRRYSPRFSDLIRRTFVGSSTGTSEGSAVETGAIDRMPMHVTDLLLAA